MQRKFRKWTRLGLRFGVPVGVLAVCGALIADKLTAEMLASLPDQLADITWGQWGLAAAFTAISMWSVGQYDALAHRFLRTGIVPAHARGAGTIGIALGQILGFGLVTGAVARWRMLPGLGLAGALRLSAFVSVSFVAGWVVVTSLVCLLLPAPDWTRLLAVPGVLGALAVAAALFHWPVLRWRGRSLRLPNLKVGCGILGWVLVDTITAAAALHTMLPAGSIAFASFFPLFMIAMGTALISNTPGGVGPFELVLLTALPQVGPAPVLAAILAYRVVYYAVPAALAAVALLRPYPHADPGAAARHADLLSAPRSEVAVVYQNGGAVLEQGRAAAAFWPTGQTVTLFADPLAGSGAANIDLLRRRAAEDHAVPVIYKCGARLAASARRHGWRLLHLADDAVIELADYATDVPARRTLRRKLRAADKNGVTVRAGGPLPYAEMARIDAAWQARNGRARGGSMGRYCPEYLVDQWVCCAYADGALVAYISCHLAHGEWCLDLMRQDDTVPDGAMHLLVQTAIEAARAAGARRFNMAATPACPDPASAFWRWVAVKVVETSGGSGLRQFKSNFAPGWQPRYAAARSWPGLVLGLADIARAIHHPPPLTSDPSTDAHETEAHEVDENYEVASRNAA